LSGESHPGVVLARAAIKVPIRTKRRACDPVLAQQQAKQEEHEEKKQGAEDALGIATITSDLGAHPKQCVQRREHRLVAVSVSAVATGGAEFRNAAKPMP